MSSKFFFDEQEIRAEMKDKKIQIVNRLGLAWEKNKITVVLENTYRKIGMAYQFNTIEELSSYINDLIACLVHIQQEAPK